MKYKIGDIGYGIPRNGQWTLDSYYNRGIGLQKLHEESTIIKHPEIAFLIKKEAIDTPLLKELYKEK